MRGGADPGAGLEVGGRVALGHRDRREPAVLAGVEDVPGRDPLRRLGHLAAEPVVGQALVGVAAAALVDHQPAAEAEGERAAAVGLLEAGAEPAQRRGSRSPHRARPRPRSARRCWCRAVPWSRRCRRARRGRGASSRCPRSRRRPAARRGVAPISIGPSGDIAATPTTRPSSSVTSPVTGRLVRIVPPSRTTIVASRAIRDCPPLRVLRPPSPARSRSTGGRTSSATSGRSSARLMLVGWIDRPNGTRPGAS